MQSSISTLVIGRISRMNFWKPGEVIEAKRGGIWWNEVVTPRMLMKISSRTLSPPIESGGITPEPFIRTRDS